MAPRGRPSREALFARLDTAIGELHEVYGGLPSPEQADDIWSDLWHRDTHHSTAIEGNTLALTDVEQLLERGRTARPKPMAEYLRSAATPTPRSGCTSRASNPVPAPLW
ncbi:hypothetical protein GCM10029992_02500 [Glycomyces albus]